MRPHNFVVLVSFLIFCPLTLHANQIANSGLTARIANLEEHISTLESKLSAPSSTKGYQENLPNLQARLLDLEEKVRELNGKVQYFDHTYKKITDRINSLSNDINYRLSALEGKEINKTTVSEAQSIDKYRKMIEEKNYPGAVAGLREYIRTNKDILDLDEAYYWIGKAYMSQEMYEESGNYFFKYYTQYPQKNKASESLLNLAISFMKLEKYNSGCKILDNLDREYPNRSASEKSMSIELRTLMECPS